MKKKKVMFGTALAAMFVVAGCAPTVPGEGLDESTGAESTDTAASEETLKIAFVSHTQDVTDLFGQMKLGFEAALEEAGVDYELTAAAPPNSENHEAMDRILTDLRAVGPDYMVFGPTSYELNEPRLEELESDGTDIVMVDVVPPPSPAIDPLTWVVYSHETMGNVAASTVASQACESGDDDVQVALFWGPAASEVSQERGLGIIEGLETTFAECGVSYTIVEEVFADFNLEKAYNLMDGVATAHPDMDIAIGFNSNTALGMSQSLLTTDRLEGVSIVTMGGQPNELAALCRGEINNSVFRDPWDMGRLAAAAIISDLAGEAESLEEIVYTDLAPITSCDDVFNAVPRDILEQDEFRGGIDESLWQD